MLPVKASLLVPRREFIVSRRKKLVPKMELDDSDNRSLVATSGTCSISDCLAAEITRPGFVDEVCRRGVQITFHTKRKREKERERERKKEGKENKTNKNICVILLINLTTMIA